MNSTKLIAVTGATGQQGGATVRHLLSRGFRVRGLTRDVNSAGATALRTLGAETIAADRPVAELTNPAALC